MWPSRQIITDDLEVIPDDTVDVDNDDVEDEERTDEERSVTGALSEGNSDSDIE